ncbi:melanoregulin-like [Protopterus annectens]|uniref:melanoregulin-like n=1 Tax=Protopterus annectens TaxID=7888 RepID=UPI001CF96693|nr:melanoregulin-like [Protopterus annectens]
MAGKSALSRIFCCCCEDEEEAEEKSRILSETLLYFDRETKRRRAEETNLWSEPHDASHMERDDDRELYNLLHRRAKTRRGSEGYRRLSFDIHAMRQVRRNVKERWKMVLEQLGFQNEADSLLTVTSNMPYNSLKFAVEARELLKTLAQQTDIFDDNAPPPERYLFVLDRLLILDTAYDFVSKAKRYYPKDASKQSEKETEETEVPTAVLVNHNETLNMDEGEEECDASAEVDEETFMSKSLD